MRIGLPEALDVLDVVGSYPVVGGEVGTLGREKAGSAEQDGLQKGGALGQKGRVGQGDKR